MLSGRPDTHRFTTLLFASAKADHFGLTCYLAATPPNSQAFQLAITRYEIQFVYDLTEGDAFW